MAPWIQAVQEPHLWVCTDMGERHLIVSHPNGIIFKIQRTLNTGFWSIQELVGPPGTPGVRYRLSIPCRTPARDTRPISLDACVADTLLVAGAEVMARMDRFLVDLRCWAWTIAPHTPRIILQRFDNSIMLLPDTRVVPLEQPLLDRFHALNTVMIADHDMMEACARIHLDVPATAHDMMHLRGQHADP